ncbi:MAG: hypothetical protein WB791_09380 [Waddliaceae bacterium]
MSKTLSNAADAKQQDKKDLIKQGKQAYDRLALGVDIGTSHCEVLVYGKNYDEHDEEAYHYSEKPISVSCISSLILFAKENESSMNYVLKFQRFHDLPLQEEYLDGVKVPYVYYQQIEDLLKDKKMTAEEFDTLKRSTNTHYPVKTKKEGSNYCEREIAVIRLNIGRLLNPYIKMGMPLDITFAKPCEAGAGYDKILQEMAAAEANKNGTNDNRFMIRSEAVFTGHFLINMLESPHQTIAVCDIGAGTGDVYIFDQDDSKTKAMKTFTSAGNYVTLELMNQLKEHSDIEISELDANNLKEKYGYINGFRAPKTVKPVLVDLYSRGKQRKARTGKSLDAASRPMAHAAVNTIIKVFEEYDGYHPKSVALTGYQGQLEGLDKAIEEGLLHEGYKVTVKNLYAFGEADPRNIVGKAAENYSRSLKNNSWIAL